MLMLNPVQLMFRFPPFSFRSILEPSGVVITQMYHKEMHFWELEVVAFEHTLYLPNRFDKIFSSMHLYCVVGGNKPRIC